MVAACSGSLKAFALVLGTPRNRHDLATSRNCGGELRNGRVGLGRNRDSAATTRKGATLVRGLHGSGDYGLVECAPAEAVRWQVAHVDSNQRTTTAREDRFCELLHHWRELKELCKRVPICSQQPALQSFREH